MWEVVILKRASSEEIWGPSNRRREHSYQQRQSATNLEYGVDGTWTWGKRPKTGWGKRSMQTLESSGRVVESGDFARIRQDISRRASGRDTPGNPEISDISGSRPTEKTVTSGGRRGS